VPVPAFRESDVRALVGAGAWARGTAYARDRRVLDTHWDNGTGRLAGRVVGSGAVYSVRVQLDPDGAVIGGVCTCPVHLNCKHVAALLLTATGPEAAPAGDRPAPWASLLDQLLRPQPFERPRAGAPLALLLEVQPDPGADRAGVVRAHRLAARPAVRGAKDRWVRTNAGWVDVLHGYSPLDADPAQRDALRTVHRVIADPAEPAGWGGPAWLALDRAPGAALWATLADLARVGVALVGAAAPHRPARLLEQHACARLDLREGETGLGLRPVVEIDGRTLDPERLGLLGLPDPVGVYWWDRDGALALARFAEPLDRRAEPLLTMPGSLRVPTGTVAQFWSSYAPRLAGLLPLTSQDGSVQVPEPAAARLRLQVTAREQHTVTLSWWWAYTAPDGTGPEPVPVGRPDPLGQPWRSLPAETALLTAATGAVERAIGPDPAGGDPGPGSGDVARVDRLRAALIGPLAGPRGGRPLDPPDGPHGGPVADQAGGGAEESELTGWDTVELVQRVLPALRAVDGVDVVVTGELPEFREASSPVTVRVGTGDDEPGALGGDRDWFDLTVTVEVDGRQVPLEAVLRALTLGEDRVLLDDGLWLRVDSPSLAALRALVVEARALDDTRRGPLRVSRWDVGAWAELVDLGVVVQQAAAWTAAVQQLADLADPVPDEEPPAAVRATLRPYQKAGFSWLRRLAAAGLGGILADDMGLGKTLQVLTFAAWWRTVEAGRAGPLLVVAPTSVVGTWAGEAARFTPGLVVRTVTATAARRGAGLAELAEGADVVVTSYTLFRIEAEGYRSVHWSALVLDEAQAVKNHESRGYAAVRALPAPVKIAITGTPLENSVIELWALLGLVAPGLFPSLQRFTAHYRIPIEREQDAERLAELRRRIRPLLLRRTKDQVAADLPPRLEHVVAVELAPRHRALYDRYLARERQKVLGLLEDFDGNRFEIFRSLTLLRRLALDPSLVDEAHHGVPASKLDHLAPMLDEIVADGHRVLVFSQFTGVLGRVRDRLDAAGTAYSYLDGTTTRRAQVIDAFRSGTDPVFLISLRAGGVGLTLTEADYVVLLDPWWNPAVEAQAVDRVHRIGQSRQVMVYRLVAAGTIEDKVMALKSAKARLFDSVLGGGELGGGRLNAADVRALLG
jgi:superfamily II DNA or RNA helicase